MYARARFEAIRKSLGASAVMRHFVLSEVSRSRVGLSIHQQRYERLGAGHTHPGSENLLPRMRRDGARVTTQRSKYDHYLSDLSLRWCLGVSVAWESSGKDAQQRRSLDCVQAESDTGCVADRKDTAVNSAKDHLQAEVLAVTPLSGRNTADSEPHRSPWRREQQAPRIGQHAG